MIEVSLPDGRIAIFPDGTPAEAIERAIADHLAQNAVDHTPEPSSPEPCDGKVSLPEPIEIYSGNVAGIDASLEPRVVVPPRIRIEPYTADDDNGFGELATRLPEYAPAGGICRAVLERSRLPAARAIDPPSDTFAHNWWPNWHRPR